MHDKNLAKFYKELFQLSCSHEFLTLNEDCSVLDTPQLNHRHTVIDERIVHNYFILLKIFVENIVIKQNSYPTTPLIYIQSVTSLL